MFSKLLIEMQPYCQAPNDPGVSRSPPTRSPTVKTDAQLWQLGNVGCTPCWALPAEQVLCWPTSTRIYKASVARTSVYSLPIR